MATIEQVQGNYSQARSACARVAGQGDLLTAITCGAGVASLTGAAQTSADLLQRQLQASPNSADAIRLWAWTLLGEMRARVGDDDAAATAFQEALGIDAEDVYARSASMKCINAATSPTGENWRAVRWSWTTMPMTR